jgi:hypothetical protein
MIHLKEALEKIGHGLLFGIGFARRVPGYVLELPGRHDRARGNPQFQVSCPNCPDNPRPAYDSYTLAIRDARFVR